MALVSSEPAGMILSIRVSLLRCAARGSTPFERLDAACLGGVELCSNASMGGK